MWLSSTAQTALRAVVHLARVTPGTRVPVADLAIAIERPGNYLSKTLNTLRRAGVLTATRGPGGGFALARPAEELTLHEVIAPFVPLEARRCLLGGGVCSDKQPCAAHAEWSHVAAQVETFFGTATVATLLERA